MEIYKHVCYESRHQNADFSRSFIREDSQFDNQVIKFILRSTHTSNAQAVRPVVVPRHMWEDVPKFKKGKVSSSFADYCMDACDSMKRGQKACKQPAEYVPQAAQIVWKRRRRARATTYMSRKQTRTPLCQMKNLKFKIFFVKLCKYFCTFVL